MKIFQNTIFVSVHVTSIRWKTSDPRKPDRFNQLIPDVFDPGRAKDPSFLPRIFRSMTLSHLTVWWILKLFLTSFNPMKAGLMILQFPYFDNARVRNCEFIFRAFCDDFEISKKWYKVAEMTSGERPINNLHFLRIGRQHRKFDV